MRGFFLIITPSHKFLTSSLFGSVTPGGRFASAVPFYMFSTGCSLKIVFFPNSLQPIPCKPGDQLILVRNLSVQSLLFFSHFPNGAERGGCKILKILGKNIIFSEHPVPEKFMSLEYLRRSFDNSLLPPLSRKKGVQ